VYKPPQRIKYRADPGPAPSAETARDARLFSPLRYRNLRLDHRTWVPAMVPWRASEEGFVTDDILAWYERMATIETYEQDESAMARINAWWTAFNLAKDRWTGGGFETFRERVYMQYAPNPDLMPDAHSIYFEIMGEHGFIGLAIFLLLAWFTWNTGSRIKRMAKHDTETKWAADLASMLQVSLVGYASSGAFLGLAYFDLYYTLVAVMVICKVVVEEQLAEDKSPEMVPQGVPQFGK